MAMNDTLEAHHLSAVENNRSRMVAGVRLEEVLTTWRIVQAPTHKPDHQLPLRAFELRVEYKMNVHGPNLKEASG